MKLDLGRDAFCSLPRFINNKKGVSYGIQDCIADFLPLFDGARFTGRPDWSYGAHMPFIIGGSRTQAWLHPMWRIGR